MFRRKGHAIARCLGLGPLLLALAWAPLWAGGCAPPLPVAWVAPSESISGSRAPSAATAESTAAGALHLALGEPRDADPSDDIRLDHGVFVLSYNPVKRVANWVAWRLVADDIGAVKRTDAFHADELLPAEVTGPRPRDYRRGREGPYDRGHMCPSGDRTASAAANEETFVMTNMQPQRHALNAGPWEGLERYERGLTDDDRQVFIVAGGLFDVAPPTLDSGVAVPRANFKIIVVLERGESAGAVTRATKTYAVIMPNTATVSGTTWWQYLVSIHEIERESGYDFLSLVPGEIQRAIEARAAAPPVISAE